MRGEQEGEQATKKSKLLASDAHPPARLYPEGLHNLPKQCPQLGTKLRNINQEMWFMPVILAPGRWRPKKRKSKDILCYPARSRTAWAPVDGISKQSKHARKTMKEGVPWINKVGVNKDILL